MLPWIAGFSAAFLLWLPSSWLIADHAMKTRLDDAIQEETPELNEQAGNAARSIAFGLAYLHGIPSLVAKDRTVLAALSRPETAAPPQARKAAWSADAELVRVDGYLAEAARSLRADAIWVIDAAGDCIAASNVDDADSFVGVNYADRDYFRTARAGKPGRQYAVGRISNVPGLFFSAPIRLDGRLIGVAVAKIGLPKLSHWVNQTNTFLSDEHGVVILASDPALEMRSLPGADVVRMSEPERLARYKRSDFRPLAITAWDAQRFPTLHRIAQDSQPALLSAKRIADEALELHTFKPLPEAADFEPERLKLFLLLSMAGSLALSVAAGATLFARIRRRSEWRAAESASLLRAAIEATADGILVVDNERRLTTCNRRFAEIWRIPPETVAGGRDAELLNRALDQLEDPASFVGRLMELYARPEQASFDTLRLKDGTEIERYSSPQRLGERVVGRVWSFRDVTDQRRAERALRDSRDELENKVQQRTADLQSANLALRAEKAAQETLIKELAEAHSQLLQAEKMASIGQLAAGMSHEINNPVGFVFSNLSTLQYDVADLLKLLAAYEDAEAELTAPTRTSLATLKQSVDFAYLRDDLGKLLAESLDGLQRVKNIVQNLRDFSRVGESGNQWASIEEGLENTLKLVGNELKYKAEVVKQFGGVPEIECFPSQINQVFMNLLLNAAESIEGHGRISVRTGRDGDEVWAEIADTGSGIPPENLKRIFDPFFTTKPVGKGTGLGLSLSYGIVQQHHGHIEVASEPGKGSVFRVRLPQRQPRAE